MVPGNRSGMQLSGRQPVGDTTNTKIFVGGLAWETQNETLRRYFEQFGEIIEAVVINDKHTGRSKGYGFVSTILLLLLLFLFKFRYVYIYIFGKESDNLNL